MRFIKDTIETWAFDPTSGNPLGVTQPGGNTFVIAQGTRVGVYQNIATRAGGEVISADQF